MNVTNPVIWGPPLWDIFRLYNFQVYSQRFKESSQIIYYAFTEPLTM